MGEFHLAGDIGGTKTTLAVVDEDQGPKVFLEKETFKSRDFHSLRKIVNEFLSKRKIQISSASFGIAGPASDGKVQATNLPWLVTEKALSKELSVPVRILNDLSATAHAVPYLDADEVLLLKTGKPEKQGTIGVIAPGTGLGEAYLTWGGNRYRAFSSEGGHADFAPVNELQIRLMRFLQK